MSSTEDAVNPPTTQFCWTVRTGRRGRFQEHLAQGVHLRLLDVSQKLERQMDGLRLGPSDLDGLTAPCRTGDLPFQLRLHTAYLTLQGVGKLNGDKCPQHFFYGRRR